MTPVYLNPPPSSFSLAEEEEDQHLNLFFNSSLPYQSSSSSSSSSSSFSSSSLSPSIFFNSLHHQDQSGTTVGDQSQQHDHKADKPIWNGSSTSNYQVCASSSVQPPMGNEIVKKNGQRDQDQEEDEGGSKSKDGSVKWMSSKMRLMKKMMKPADQQIPAATGDKRERNNTQLNFSLHNTNNTVRVCSDCNTTTTPLWRSGPRGPKSLCNACGIRQRKARKAMSEAAATSNGLGEATTDSCSSLSIKTNKLQCKEKKLRVAHFKNKCKLVDPNSCNTTTTAATSSMISTTQTKLCSFNHFGFGHGVFPQADVAEAAILLMELSCGFIHS